MTSAPKAVLASIAALVAVLLLLGCGGGGGDATTEGGNGQAQATTASPGQAQPESAPSTSSGQAQSGESGNRRSPSTPSSASSDSPTGAAQFKTNGGDNSIQEFGSEGSASALELAATALHGYLEAHSAGEWARACSYLANELTESLIPFSGSSEPQPCPKLIAALGATANPVAQREEAIARVGALRVEGGRGYILFQGARGADYFMPMLTEAGAWKVDALAASPLG